MPHHSRYSVSVSGAAAATGAVYAAMMAGATKAVSIRSITVVLRQAIVSEVALVRSFAIGTGTTVATGVPHRTPSPASTAWAETAWSTAPTGATGTASYLRRDLSSAAATGTRIELWREEDGPIVLEPLKALLIKNSGSGAGAALDLHFTWDEGL